MASRSDITNDLIHFIAAESEKDAFDKLRTIIRERRLIGGNRMIRLSYRCVCFTEAPLAAFADDFIKRVQLTRYSHFGLIFSKKLVYDCGGRPVIYQPESELNLLPEELRWRHVRFEPTAEPPIDFTWEREWRIHCDELPFSPTDAVVVLPNESWIDKLRRSHDDQQDIEVEQYATMLDRDTAELYRERFRWRVVSLQ